MEMLSCSVAPCSPAEKGKERRAVWFLMSEGAGACLCVCAGMWRFTANESNITLPQLRRLSLLQRAEGSSAALSVIIHDTRCSLKSWKCLVVPRHQAFIHHTQSAPLSATVALAGAGANERPFFSNVFVKCYFFLSHSY